MIDYAIISKALLPLIRSLYAVMNAPWGPHFGLALTLNAKIDEFLLRILVQPSVPPNVLEILKPKSKGKSKPSTENKIDKIKEREQQHARNVLEQSDNAGAWCKTFLQPISRRPNWILLTRLRKPLRITR